LILTVWRYHSHARDRNGLFHLVFNTTKCSARNRRESIARMQCNVPHRTPCICSSARAKLLASASRTSLYQTSLIPVVLNPPIVCADLVVFAFQVSVRTEPFQSPRIKPSLVFSDVFPFQSASEGRLLASTTWTEFLLRGPSAFPATVLLPVCGEGSVQRSWHH